MTVSCELEICTFFDHRFMEGTSASSGSSRFGEAASARESSRTHPLVNLSRGQFSTRRVRIGSSITHTPTKAAGRGLMGLQNEFVGCKAIANRTAYGS